MESDFIKSIKLIDRNDTDSNETYHGKPGFISASSLKKMKVSPLHYKEEEKKETEALSFGSAYHTFVLEPEKFEAQYYVLDETDILEILFSEGAKKPRATTKYKEWYMLQENEANGRYIIDLPTYRLIKKMSDRIRKHPYANSLMTKGVSEESIYVELHINPDYTQGIQQTVNVRIRPDYSKVFKRCITDLKSAQDASEDSFANDAGKYDYHIQAALYTDIMQHLTGDLSWKFFFIAQEKKQPFAFNIFQASNQFISQGRYEYEQLILLYLTCVQYDWWPGYQVFCENKYGVLDLNLKPYHIKEINFYNHFKS